jgi:myo-inositol 2-dehydrogenase/D-chiro-inositol 1-dehydrogenase
MGAFLATMRGENVGAPDIADGAKAMALLERAIGVAI